MNFLPLFQELPQACLAKRQRESLHTARSDQIINTWWRVFQGNMTLTWFNPHFSTFLVGNDNTP